MASETPTKSTTEPRPGSLRSTKSFPRHQISEANDPLQTLKRAHTFHDGTVPKITIAETGSPQKQPPSNADTFESEDNEESFEPPRASVDMDEIPIELVSTIDK